MQPLVSVVVPVYNVERYVAAAIQSVLDQTYDTFELLLIDDGSPDRSVEICQQFTDPRIRLLRQENRGLSGARNTGIREAKGEYVAFLDSDDQWQPEKLRSHVEHLARSPKVGVSFSRSQFMDEQGQLQNAFQNPRLTDITPAYLLCENPVGNGSAPVVRREVFEAIATPSTRGDFNYFDEQLRRCEDLDCWLRIALQTSWTIEGLSAPLTLYRVNSGGLSANLLKQLEAWEMVVAKARSLDPGLVGRSEALGRAYQLLYLARTALRLGDRALAYQLVNRALQSKGTILFKEPRRTLLTLALAYLGKVRPGQAH
jgi:glycosyltransferase involved in cell wall biosynthesis